MIFSRGRICLLIFSALTPASAAKKPVTIDEVVRPRTPRHGEIVWAPDGERFVAKDRNALLLYDARSGKEREIITLDKLDNAAAASPAPRVFDWTNRHTAESDVQWFADGKRLLVSASGDLFVVDVNKGSFVALTQTPEFERDPKLSPDNAHVSFRRGFDLFTIDVETRRVIRLTSDGSATVLNGQTDWVYAEELDLRTAHWWSPDSRSIAYLQFDISREPMYPQVSLLNARGLLEPERYPKAGDPNAEVRLGIVPAGGGATKWMDLGEPRGFLLARVVWSPDSREIMAARLPRVQNKLDLLMADAVTGTSRAVLHEEDPTWLNVKAAPLFIGKGDRFLWTSERSGFRHLYVFEADGKLRSQLTSGDWEVDEIAGVTGDDEHGRVLFTSTEADPTERQVYSVALDGSGKQRLSKTAGTHAISMAPQTGFYLDDYSNLTTPPQSSIFKPDGGELRVYRAASYAAAEEFEILPAAIVSVKTADGALLYAKLIKPAGFEADKKYPAVVTVYGGPDAQAIRNTWQGLTWDQAMAHKGFVVWQLDNRGSSGRGHGFESAVYHNLGANELKDQKEGLRYLLSLGFVDPDRVGLYGWSYGGYMTLFTITGAPGLFRAAVAGAPVTNWRNYDSIYTERYMGLPDENQEGYANSAPALRASAMGKTKLLMLHNVEDDNVHFQNSLQMADALEKAGKQFFMVVYPQKTHHVDGPANRQLLETITSFFEDNLK